MEPRSSARNPRSKRPKTFTGCGTCRSRHLKCDEARPSCLRCTRAKLECSGYPGYRDTLRWRPITGPPNLRSTSSSTTSRDGKAGNVKDTCSVEVDESTSETPSNVHCGHSSKSVGQTAEFVGVWVANDVSPGTNDNIIKDHGHIKAGANDDPKTGETNLLEFGFHGTYNELTFANYHRRKHFQTDSAPLLRHLDQLTKMDRQRRLIEHWIIHLSDALAPVPGPNNPLKTALVPMAYEGALAPACDSTGSVALFHIICAASAFHLSATSETENCEFRDLALYHHSQGLRHLQHSIAGNDADQHVPVLASLLVCIYYEPVTAETRLWQIHFRGALGWLRETGADRFTGTQSAVVLYQMFVCSAVFLRSQLIFDATTQQEAILYDKSALETCYCLDQVFGISKQVFCTLDQLITLVGQQRRQVGLVTDPSMNTSSHLDQIELELYLSMPTIPDPVAMGVNAIMISHYLQLFYFAALIYCKRMLRNVPVEEVQFLVAKSLHHMEELRTCVPRPSSPIVWPIAVTCFETCDIILKRRVTLWLDFIIHTSSLSIWRRVRAVVLSLWEQRTAGGDLHLRWDVFLNNPSTTDMMMV